jgi:hypothetical protein
MICMTRVFRMFVNFRRCNFHIVIEFHCIKKVTKEQALGLDKNRKKFDIREEYYVCVALCITELVIYTITRL